MTSPESFEPSTPGSFDVLIDAKCIANSVTAVGYLAYTTCNLTTVPIDLPCLLMVSSLKIGVPCCSCPPVETLILTHFYGCLTGYQQHETKRATHLNPRLLKTILFMHLVKLPRYMIWNIILQHLIPISSCWLPFQPPKSMLKGCDGTNLQRANVWYMPQVHQHP